MASFSFVFLAVSLWLSGAAALTNTSSIISTSELAALNSSVKGRLFRSTPFALPCFSTFNGQPNVDFDNTACAAVQANYGVPEFRTPRFGAYMEVRCGPLLFRVGTNRLLTNEMNTRMSDRRNGKHARTRTSSACWTISIHRTRSLLSIRRASKEASLLSS